MNLLQLMDMPLDCVDLIVKHVPLSLDLANLSLVSKSLGESVSRIGFRHVSFKRPAENGHGHIRLIEALRGGRCETLAQNMSAISPTFTTQDVVMALESSLDFSKLQCIDIITHIDNADETDIDYADEITMLERILTLLPKGCRVRFNNMFEPSVAILSDVRTEFCGEITLLLFGNNVEEQLSTLCNRRDVASLQLAIYPFSTFEPNVNLVVQTLEMLADARKQVMSIRLDTEDFNDDDVFEDAELNLEMALLHARLGRAIGRLVQTELILSTDCNLACATLTSALTCKPMTIRTIQISPTCGPRIMEIIKEHSTHSDTPLNVATGFREPDIIFDEDATPSEKI